jgi:8-oxo-dGTP pyrophosphatase MutT (NUDIX family)
MRKLSPGAAAAREAFEEAGLEGSIESEEPLGYYHYDKTLDDGSSARVKVLIFLMRVARQRDTWPEQIERETRWCDPEEAAELVEEPELAAVLFDLRSLVSGIR